VPLAARHPLVTLFREGRRPPRLQRMLAPVRLAEGIRGIRRLAKSSRLAFVDGVAR